MNQTLPQVTCNKTGNSNLESNSNEKSNLLALNTQHFHSSWPCGLYDTAIRCKMLKKRESNSEVREKSSGVFKSLGGKQIIEKLDLTARMCLTLHLRRSSIHELVCPIAPSIVLLPLAQSST